MTGIVVERARLYEIALPLREPFRISGGSLDVRRSLIVELRDGGGHIGYGESAPFEAPFFSAETIASARVMLLGHLLPRLLGATVSHPAELHQLLSVGVVGNQMARAGAETAWWDLRATRDELGLVDLVTARLEEMGVPRDWLRRSDRIECGIALGIPEDGRVDTVREQVASAVERGYRRVKLKVKPGWDVDPVWTAREVLERAAADLPITVDANGAYRLARDLDDLRRLDSAGLLYLEQPLPAEALWDLRELAGLLETPVCLDESLDSDEIARQVLDMGGPTVWNLKIQRVGGLEEACRIYARAARGGVRLWGGTMPETGIGAQAMLALGCHAGFVYPSDLEPSERWYGPGRDVVTLEMGDDGTMPVPRRRPRMASKDGWELLAELR